MFAPNTLFIVGAGASQEVGMPTGSDFKNALIDEIDIRYQDGYKLLSGDPKIPRALKLHLQELGENRIDINPFLYSAWNIKNAMPQALSIDNYIEAHSGDKKIELMAKLGIVSSILKFERKSFLYYTENEKREFNFNRLNNSWFVKFSQILTERMRKEKIQDIFKNVSFICFNYDRCIEQYLALALEVYYSITDIEARSLVKTLKIYHPYGTVGDNAWKDKSHKDIAFGEEIESKQLLYQSRKIKTFSEQIEEKETLKKIKNEVSNAETIIFLGMAYHQQNIELLNPSSKTRVKRIFGTALGISDSDLRVVHQQLTKMISPRTYPGKIKIELRNDLTSQKLFQEYQRNFSLI